MAITQNDIAKRLGVSVMTVSKALSNHPDVNKKTREHVLRLADEMNYRVNIVARNLVQRKTSTIGVIVPDISELFYAEIMNGIESITRQNNYKLLFANSDNDPEIEINSLYILLDNRVDGFLFCPTERNQDYITFLKTIQIPHVLINNATSGLQCDTVSIDRFRGAFDSIEHLIHNGYKDIYFFYTFSHTAQCQNSIDGCKKAFENSGLPADQLKLIECPERRLDIFHQKTLENIALNNRKIGIFVWDDEMAIGVYRAITEMNQSIPDQVGIIGFDNIKLAQFLPKALTTVHYPKFDMGQKSAELLLRRIQSKEFYKPEHVTLDLTFVPRETTLQDRLLKTHIRGITACDPI